MKIGNAVVDGKNVLVIAERNGIRVVDTLPDSASDCTGLSTDYLIRHPDAMNSLRNNSLESFPLLENEKQVDFSPCVFSPGKIVCVGLNYHGHAKETRATLQETPVLFSKFSDCVTGHRNSVTIPETVSRLDYEAELGIVIGKDTYHVKQENALEHVFGYFPANDVSARDLQFLNGQWLLGKTLPGFAPIGPFITTAEEVPDPNALHISLRLNDEIRQDSNTRDMIFHCDYIISYISQYFPLKPGDIILTGTPEGVVLGKPHEERVWLKPGDVTEVEIEKLGSLVTHFKSP